MLGSHRKDKLPFYLSIFFQRIALLPHNFLLFPIILKTISIHTLNFPHHDASRDAYVHRVLGSILGNFKGLIASVYHVLSYSFYFIAHYECIAAMRLKTEGAKFEAALYLFYCQYCVTFLLQ